jgi:hypothetical protein
MGVLLQAAYTQTGDWDKSITLEVRAPDHRKDGKTWDMEIPVLIGAFMPTAGDPAPDMMLCVVDGAGREHCIHEASRNAMGVPYSICPNAYVCTFSNVKVPGTGYYGVLIVDLDFSPSRQDYMLAAILRNGGQEDPAQAWKIEKALRALAQKWHVVGAPDEFAQSDAAECTPRNPCFGDSRAGIPSLSIGSTEAGKCGMPMTGEVEFNPGNAPQSVAFDFRMNQNECPGGTEFTWNFGDGATISTRQPQAAHAYGRAGQYTVSVVPRCIRKTSACDARAVSTQVTIGR